MTDWRPGDFAIAKKNLPPSTITAGKFLTVSRVICHPELGLGLMFEGVPIPAPYTGFKSKCFIKVTPPSDMIERERRTKVGA